MFSYDPAQLIAGFHKPVLIVQGERDLQVSVADAKRLKQAAPAAKLVLLPDTNHVFKTVKSAEYGGQYGKLCQARRSLSAKTCR